MAFFLEFEETLVSLRMDEPLLESQADRAVRFDGVRAVAKPALLAVLCDLNEVRASVFGSQIPKAELSYPRRVNHVSTRRQMHQLSGGGGMFASTRLGIHFGSLDLDAGTKLLQER